MARLTGVPLHLHPLAAEVVPYRA